MDLVGGHPAPPNIGGVADWKYSTQAHTWGVSQFGKKFLEKSLEGIRIMFYLWRVGGFVLRDRSSFVYVYRKFS
jgi:hypothetical protein